MRPGATATLMLMVAVFAATVVGNALQTTADRVLIVSVPEGGTIGTVSKNFSCGAGETCEFQIDGEFHEVFIAQYKVGYRFSSWKQSNEHFCGGQIANCTITAATADSLSRLEPLFDRDVASTGYAGIRKLDYSDMRMDWKIGCNCFDTARVYTDFDGDGVLDLFRPVGDFRSIERQHLEMWLGNGDGTYRRDDGMLVNPTIGGFHPWKAVVADFNGDGKADVIVADSGYDNFPFPGAPLLLYMSTADGKLVKAKGLDHIMGFHHSVTVGDIDGDGDTDVFAHPAKLLINDGKGNMTLNTTYLPKDHVHGATSELIDVDRDGHLDLLIGGEEFSGDTSVVLWGTTETGFVNSTVSTLPAVTDFGIIADIDVADFDGDGINDILLNRVGSEPGRGYYDGSYLQLLKGGEDLRTFADITESSIDNEELLTYSDADTWFRRLIVQDWDFDGDLDIVVDDLVHRIEIGLVLINNGRSAFSTLEVAQP